MKKICVMILAMLWLSPLAFSLRPDIAQEIERVERDIADLKLVLANCASLLEDLKPPPANASEDEKKKFKIKLETIEGCIRIIQTRLDPLRKRLADLASRLPNVVQPPHREDPAIAQLRQRIKEAQKAVEEDQKKIDTLKDKVKKLLNPR